MTLFPVYTTVVAAFKPGNKVLVNPLDPRSVHPRTTRRRVERTDNLGRYLFNSFVVAVVVTVVPGRHVVDVRRTPSRCSTSRAATCCSRVFLATLLVPIEATLVVNRRTVD